MLYSILDLLDSLKVEYWIPNGIPLNVFNIIMVRVTSDDDDAETNWRKRVLKVSRFNRKDQRVEVMVDGIVDFWSYDQVSAFIQERGVRL